MPKFKVSPGVDAGSFSVKERGHLVATTWGGPAKAFDDRTRAAERYARQIAAMPDLISAGHDVVAAWERGDLAAAVRQLAAALNRADG